MTRIKRPVRTQQRLTLAVLSAALFGLFSLSYCLFQMDAFPNQRNNNKHTTSNTNNRYHKNSATGDMALTPDKLIVGGNLRNSAAAAMAAKSRIQQQQHVPANNSNNNNNNGEIKVLHQNSDSENVSPQEAVSDTGITDNNNNRHHYYEMDIHSGGGLADDSNNKIGTVLFEMRPDWAPLGAAHFEDLIAANYYQLARFFRVVPNFMVQFGIPADPAVHAKWRQDILKDDPVRETNRRGTMTYAMAGKNTRTTQIFINTNHGPNGNKALDQQGFAPFAEVLRGMEFVDLINDEYREQPKQGKIVQQGNAYLQSEFPRLSYIKSIRRVEYSSAHNK